MGMTKIITPGSYDFHEPVVQHIKVASGGLRGHDLNQFIKRASVQFVDKIASMKREPGEELIHLLAIGTTEHYGPNRNGDGFTEGRCRQYHPTFQKYARWYRHHQNKDTSKGRGIIKVSAFNERMKRVELLVSLNATKEAAERNGGLIADQEIEKLARGEDIPVSMACRVSHDVCSGCGNRARTRAEYCGPELCKYGGLRDNIAKVFEDGHILHADNPDPHFFDISQVFRPADRIAYALGKAAEYMGMLKAAHDSGAHVSGAEWAERLNVVAPPWLGREGHWTAPQLVRQLKMANALLELEETLKADPAKDMACNTGLNPARDIPDARGGEVKLAQVMAALHDQKCLLPLCDFLILMSGDSAEKVAQVVDAVAARMPGVFTRLASDPRMEDDLLTNPYLGDPAAPRWLRHWAVKHAAAWSLDRPRVVERTQRAALRGTTPPRQREMMKVASAVRADVLAKEYALYQLAMLEKHAADPDIDLLREMVVRNNYAR